jgi:solute carrier family 25 (mitochondrial folate transporter), member 32
MRDLLTDDQWRSAIQSASGLGAGAISTVLLYPLDLVKVRYQVHEKSARAYGSLGHAFRTIVAEEGMRSLFRGMSPALYGSALSWGLYMYFYQNAKERYARMADDGLIQSSWQYFFSGLEAGIICVPITNPIWLIKIRMQVQSRVKIESGVGTKDAAAKLAKNLPYRSVTGELRMAFKLLLLSIMR